MSVMCTNVAIVSGLGPETSLFSPVARVCPNARLGHESQTAGRLVTLGGYRESDRCSQPSRGIFFEASSFLSMSTEVLDIGSTLGDSRVPAAVIGPIETLRQSSTLVTKRVGKVVLPGMHSVAGPGADDRETPKPSFMTLAEQFAAQALVSQIAEQSRNSFQRGEIGERLASDIPIFVLVWQSYYSFKIVLDGDITEMIAFQDSQIGYPCEKVACQLFSYVIAGREVRVTFRQAAIIHAFSTKWNV